MWVGRQRGGVTVLHVGDGGITAERYTQRDGLAQDSVFAIHRTRAGSVWAGTLEWRREPAVAGSARDLRHPQRTGFQHGRLAARGARRHHVVRHAGRIDRPVATRLAHLQDSRRAAVERRQHAVRGSRRDPVGGQTAKGVALVQGGAVTSAGTSAPELRRAHPRLRGRCRGWLWIHATDEILRVNRQALAGNALQPGDVRRYGIADGLLGVDTVKRHRIVTQDAQGRIWFALTRGLSMADPARADGRALPAVTLVEQLTADGVSVDMRGLDSPVVQPPPDRGRLRGPQPGGARAGAFPLPPGRVRSASGATPSPSATRSIPTWRLGPIGSE